MTQDNYEGTNPCLEVELDWRHNKVRYIARLIEELSEAERFFLKELLVQQKVQNEA